eukprot:gnl/TRDRNA2_/TRDRNA2_176357_c0_seq2.p1 gnl/TRDRNA2_/TRDRNA2_176357_c0~~gnl/TRDRNA2_/TRDRNA2_176357_c0_seq2.p1  ORF type:complete len:294 (+),score=7.16 gnl/TRDRNA2_/TRDRNA2_176357_c0_seq2:74-883(+)
MGMAVQKLRRDQRLGALRVGDRVEVFSCSADAWVEGRVADLLGSDYVRIEYPGDGGLCRKTLHMHSDHLVIPTTNFANYPTYSPLTDDDDEEQVIEHDPGMCGGCFSGVGGIPANNPSDHNQYTITLLEARAAGQGAFCTEMQRGSNCWAGLATAFGATAKVYREDRYERYNRELDRPNCVNLTQGGTGPPQLTEWRTRQREKSAPGHSQPADDVDCTDDPQFTTTSKFRDDTGCCSPLHPPHVPGVNPHTSPGFRGFHPVRSSQQASR